MNTTIPFTFYFDERCLWHTTGQQFVGTFPVGGWVQPSSGAAYAESPDSKRRIKTLLDVTGLSSQVVVRSAPEASEEQLLRVHDPDYVALFRSMSDAGGGDLGYEAACGPGSFEIAALSAGLVRQAIADVLTGVTTSAYALSRPPGHHCSRAVPMGFCFFNNIAVAVEDAFAQGLAQKVVILDWDVHHGNGTQEIFYDRDDVLTISLHQDRCFPPGYSGTEDRGVGAGVGYNLNIPLYAGGGHREYLAAFDELVDPAIRNFSPDLIVIACGLDANGLDPLARMQATSETFRQLTRRLLALGYPVVAAHEGGYSESYVPFCALAVIEELSGIRSPCDDPGLEFMENQQPDDRFFDFQVAALQEMKTPPRTP